MKNLVISIRMMIFMSLLCGLAYPLGFTTFAKALFPHQAAGSLVKVGDAVVGSSLLSQKFTSDKYFWGRPSAVDYNPLPSGGSNLGPISSDLKKAVDGRYAALTTTANNKQEPPQDLLFASASGLDPHISPEAAYYQVDRVAKARGLSNVSGTAEVKELIEAATERPSWGFLGQTRVNVLKLNLALDELK
jgi:K+-transporting ATPase ATPase C chain